MPLGASSSSIQFPPARVYNTCAHSFAMHLASPFSLGRFPRVVICRACDDREGRDSLEAWDVPFLIRPRCKPERSCLSRRPINKFFSLPSYLFYDRKFSPVSDRSISTVYLWFHNSKIRSLLITWPMAI